MIKVNALSRNYGSFKAVDSVSFKIEKGEVVGLLGHNGAGKTTIMKMLTGYLEPTAGSIEIEHLQMDSDMQAIQTRIGYLPENCPVWPEMTVIENLDREKLVEIPEAEVEEATETFEDAIEPAEEPLPENN